MIELKDFIYELQQYAGQTHVLKDHYGKLSAEEKKLVMDLAPNDHATPEELFKQVFLWFESVQKQLVADDEN